VRARLLASVTAFPTLPSPATLDLATLAYGQAEPTHLTRLTEGLGWSAFDSRFVFEVLTALLFPPVGNSSFSSRRSVARCT
jgi:hypothetical protein